MTEQFDADSVSILIFLSLIYKNNVFGQLSSIHAQLRRHESPLPYFLVRKDTSGIVSLSPLEAFDSFFASTPPEAVGIPSYPSLRLTLTNISAAHCWVR